MIIEISLICITSIVIAYMFRPERSESSKFEIADYYYPSADNFTVTDSPKEPIADDSLNSSDSEVEITNYYDGLGSDYLREINEEFDERIASIQKELEYEMEEKRKVESAKEAIITPEDAELLSKRLANKAKKEIAE